MSRIIWARIGMSVMITDEQYEALKAEAYSEEASKAYGYDLYDDLDVPRWLLKKFKEEGRINGDSYIPQDEFEGDDSG